MRKLNAILNDYTNESKSIISFTSDDFERIDGVWSRPEDPNLMRLQSIESFRGYKRWADITPEHFRILITRMIRNVGLLPENERSDTSKAEVSALTFLILAYVRCLEIRTTSHIELFKINVITAQNISFEFHSEVEMAYDLPKPATDDFVVVVDNDD